MYPQISDSLRHFFLITKDLFKKNITAYFCIRIESICTNEFLSGCYIKLLYYFNFTYNPAEYHNYIIWQVTLKVISNDTTYIFHIFPFFLINLHKRFIVSAHIWKYVFYFLCSIIHMLKSWFSNHLKWWIANVLINLVKMTLRSAARSRRALARHSAGTYITSGTLQSHLCFTSVTLFIHLFLSHLHVFHLWVTLSAKCPVNAS